MPAERKAKAKMGPAAGKRPSGQQYRKARREREVREAKEALAAGEAIKPPARPADASRTHLWTVGVLAMELEQLYSEGIGASERRRCAAELGRAIGMLQTKADLERRVVELESLVEAQQEALAAERAEVEAEKRRLRGLSDGARA